MNAILGFTELLKEGRADAPKTAAWLDGIATSGRALLGLINDILDLSRLEADRMEIHRAPVEVRARIEDLRLVFGPQFERKGLSFEILTPEGLPPALMLDEQRLRQIMFNLIGNAAKFTHEGGVRVRVAYRAPDGRGSASSLRFEVEDTGIGIAEEDLGKIFEPFRQSDARHSRLYSGTGLGLSICKKLTEAMGGTLAVTSRLGEGSLFIVELPALPVVSIDGFGTGSPIVGEAVFDFKPALVLVVEDEVNNRQMLRATLEESGLRVDEAENGRLALEAVARRKPDLILLDLNLPVLSGMETIRQLRAMKGLVACPIVVLSGSQEHTEDSEAIAELTQGLLRKPVGRCALLRELAKHLETRPQEKMTADRTALAVTVDAVAAFTKEILARGRISSLRGAWASEVADPLAEVGSTFSLLAAERAAKALSKLGKDSGLSSLAALGERLSLSASIVDVHALRATIEEASRIGESIVGQAAEAGGKETE